jgi:hypothetical protein
MMRRLFWNVTTCVTLLGCSQFTLAAERTSVALTTAVTAATDSTFTDDWMTLTE